MNDCEHLEKQIHRGYYAKYPEMGNKVFFDVIWYSMCIRCGENFGGFMQRMVRGPM